MSGTGGKQDSLAANFFITKFRHISRLLMWHGRNRYHTHPAPPPVGGAHANPPIPLSYKRFSTYRRLIITTMQIRGGRGGEEEGRGGGGEGRGREGGGEGRGRRGGGRRWEGEGRAAVTVFTRGGERRGWEGRRRGGEGEGRGRRGEGRRWEGEGRAAVTVFAREGGGEGCSRCVCQGKGRGGEGRGGLQSLCLPL